ncbi:MAG: 2,3-dihydroxy-2,3-dihydro-p-cumate dehydrogenase [Candidatus Eremiobacteraeota bacterium]|nr:2,3-dihydroxy-2,3-dihydro-p-cumate dehydrogenase [Candidatus Eremiobacteraeota bacterium]
MSERLHGRTAVVTGAGTGIGRAIAERFAAEGAEVVLAGLDAAQCETVAASLRDRFGTATAVSEGDLSAAGEAEKLRELVLSRFGKVDVLVNNAGGGVILPSLDHTEETLQRTIGNNLWTTLRCTLAFVPPMLEHGYGRLVNIGAESVRNGLDAHAVYNAAKGGVHAMMTGFAREFATKGLTFNSVAPSYVAIDRPSVTREASKGPAPGLAHVRQRAVDLIPMGRGATPADVAAAVLFLASEEAGFITGQVLSVNGGSSML